MLLLKQGILSRPTNATKENMQVVFKRTMRTILRLEKKGEKSLQDICCCILFTQSITLLNCTGKWLLRPSFSIIRLSWTTIVWRRHTEIILLLVCLPYVMFTLCRTPTVYLYNYDCLNPREQRRVGLPGSNKIVSKCFWYCLCNNIFKK